MRILFCNFEYPPLGGGGGVSNALLAEELAKRHDVTVLTSKAFDLPAQSVESGVKVVRVPVVFRKKQSVASMRSMFSFVPSALHAGTKLMRQHEYDIINTHFVLPSGPVGHTLSRLGQVPHVLSLHGGDLYDPSKTFSPHRHSIFRATVRYLVRHADMVVGQSQNTLNNLHQFFTRDVDGVVVPLAIKQPPTARANSREFGFNSDDIILISVGRLITRKGLPQLIHMLRALDRDNVHLVFVGTGPMEPELRQQVAELQLQKRVHFMGFVSEEDKFKLLRMSDLYVSTTQHEGFGLVFLEAMASGLPIVCYDHGGQTDFLCNGETGHLVPLNDLNTFTDHCRHLIDNEAKRRQIGMHNEEYVIQFFVDAFAQKYEKVFEKARTVWAERNSSVLYQEKVV